LELCQQALQGYLTSLGDVVLSAEELRAAVGALGQITGLVTVDELLDVIFRDFCIGK
jgi:tRNA modification GTPase